MSRMLGFSLPKLAILVAIILVIWYAFKLFGRSRVISKRDGSVQGDSPEDGSAVDMIRCDVCGDYFVPVNNTTSCSKHV